MTCPVCHQPIDLDDLSNEVCPSCEEVYHVQEHSNYFDCFDAHYKTGYHIVVAQHQPTKWEWSPLAKPFGYYTRTNDGTGRDIWVPSLIGDND